MAVSTTPVNYPDGVTWVNNLENMLFCRYYQTGNMDDLEAAISGFDLAFSLTPLDHPEQARRLNILVNMLWRQYN